MKKGFTLVELLAVIIILGVVVMIAYPLLQNIMKTNKEKLYNEQIKRIENAAMNYVYENTSLLPVNNEVKEIRLIDLKKDGLLPVDIRNPKTNELFSDQTIIRITFNNNDYDFLVLPIFNKNNLDAASDILIELKGEYLIEVKQGTPFNEPGYIVKDNQGNFINDIYITYEKDEKQVLGIDTNVIGTYTITYTVNHNGESTSAVRTVIVTK